MGKAHPKEEMTFLMIKPDGVQRGLIGEIITRVERAGLKVVAIEMYQATKEEMDKHYPKEEAWITRLGHKSLATYEKYGYDPIEEMGTAKAEEIGPHVRRWLIDYMSSGPIVKIVVQGVHAVDMVRKIRGNTQPVLSEMGTITGDFSADSAAAANKDKRAIYNLAHASETPEEAAHEIEHWDMKKKIHKYKRMDE
ncbi:MAG: nucleoside-diphosphate kinase [Candidatus Doudnabacteria bacterium RIFCSPLOWO2_02_FULL_42_9]|uniref:nucleoside-diphosphate kinase n=1 Tax=Candidatus Doudnabacteria bacterium RIFCSPHIGHO2_01_FULL_41_86 TaxID=1817821 RepID=A0A1F5N9J3_9BACT|nr:MAG: nucleoside-diphosphate kinase [Candidatus Doudnabacteria bacterium RIFCSPHIGHO2_01_FULL_41_86]OGE75615.1 MAG: nucleoside-diphosphate kinase [Candidatus Doudnabacteria bacterium RIFCSPHIGHO2_01_43_10]OGE85410.1 MAG: nucleoside-diphosphate kinase [Candidatus Doudnabacteria bacterium RIFCSPHIGHO2_12_FULL_42_22]OGE86948.1 MAG: nucleoside-diphosphate kinase [Candidatus Doudnabacteria bacterium RIFCSPHIGHO2_02_FULL_42_25]OGE92547.1 MAG: nucleoside-diphosphate kinase [Candidatus Doudnabacteria